jgi:hypothetical protein
MMLHGGHASSPSVAIAAVVRGHVVADSRWAVRARLTSSVQRVRQAACTVRVVAMMTYE